MVCVMPSVPACNIELVSAHSITQQIFPAVPHGKSLSGMEGLETETNPVAQSWETLPRLKCPSHCNCAS